MLSIPECSNHLAFSNVGPMTCMSFPNLEQLELKISKNILELELAVSCKPRVIQIMKEVVL